MGTGLRFNMHSFDRLQRSFDYPARQPAQPVFRDGRGSQPRTSLRASLPIATTAGAFGAKSIGAIAACSAWRKHSS